MDGTLLLRDGLCQDNSVSMLRISANNQQHCSDIQRCFVLKVPECFLCMV